MADPVYSLAIELSLDDAVSGVLQDIQSIVDTTVQKVKQLQTEFSRITAINDVADQTSEIAANIETTVGRVAEVDSALQRIRTGGKGDLEAIEDQNDAYKVLVEMHGELLDSQNQSKENQASIAKIAVEMATFEARREKAEKAVNGFIRSQRGLMEAVRSNKKAALVMTNQQVKTVEKILKEAVRLQKIEGASLKLSKDMERSLKARLRERRGLVAAGAIGGRGGGGGGGGGGAAGVMGAAAIGGPWAAAGAIAAKALGAALKPLWQQFLDLIDTADSYRLTGMRLFGTIDDLTAMHLDFQKQLGATNEEIEKTLKSLIQYGAQRGEIEALAETQLKFTIATGASDEATSRFMISMRGATGNIADANRSLHLMTIASQKFGLTTQEVNAHLTIMNQQMFSLETLFGSDAPAEFSESMLAVRRAAKDVGVEGDSIVKIFSRMAQEPLKFAAVFQGMEGGVDKFAKLMMTPGMRGEAFKFAMGAVDKWNKQIREGVKPGIAGLETINSLIKAGGFSIGEFGEIARVAARPDLFEKYANQLAGVKDEAALFEEAYSEATNSLKRELIMMWNGIKAHIKDVFRPFVTETFPKIIGFINDFVLGTKSADNPLEKISNWFADISDTAEIVVLLARGFYEGMKLVLFPVAKLVEYFVKAAKWIGGIVRWLGMGEKHTVNMSKATDNIRRQNEAIDKQIAARFKMGRKSFGFDLDELGTQQKRYLALIEKGKGPVMAQNMMLDEYVKKIGLTGSAAMNARDAIMKGIMVDKEAAKQGQFKIKLIDRQIKQGDELTKGLAGLTVQKAIRTAMGKTTAETIVTAKVNTEEIKSRETTSKRANEKIEKELEGIASKVDPSVMKRIADLLEEHLPQITVAGGISPVARWRTT